ncbi:glutamine amidotransferase [Hokovirus HKV1]|uniref:Glutamine amidotransferase n=1 Tax=Hokovirus HKV1 TaxID=1977638 RepID=A0A1V0SH76_9VIRU|nr:glutamine amidotransferase [Hokovirus HKV1]
MIIIINYGSRYTENIKQVIDKTNDVKVVILDYIPEYDDSIDDIIDLGPSGIILSGSPSHIYLEGSPKIAKQLFELDIPILGICYGCQLINYINNGQVSRMEQYHGNNHLVKYLYQDIIFNNIENNLHAEMRHYDKITKLAPDYIILAETSYCIAAIKHKKKNIYGVQFHPEITDSDMNLVIDNFIKMV